MILGTTKTNQGFLCWLKGQERITSQCWKTKSWQEKRQWVPFLVSNIHFPWITSQIRPSLGLGKPCFGWPTNTSLWYLHIRWHLPSPKPPLCHSGHFAVAAECPHQHMQKDSAKPGASAPKGKAEHFPTRKPTRVLSSLSTGGTSDKAMTC